MTPKSNSITREEYTSFNQVMNEKLDNLTDCVGQVKVTIAELPEKLADKFDERYASKKTEQTVDKILWLVISAVIIAGLAFILK
jgi:hypothetical protein